MSEVIEEYQRKNNKRYSKTPYELGKGYCTKCCAYNYPKNRIFCPECGRKMRLKSKYTKRCHYEERLGLHYYDAEE